MTGSVRDQYDGSLAAKYAAIKGNLNPQQRLCYSGWLRCVGEIEDKRVLDLGCGDGTSTRFLAARKPGLLTGIDTSRPMLELARKKEVQNPLGIKYAVGDCSAVLDQRDYDLVTAMWLFHYAETEDMLSGFARTAYTSLSQGGRLVSVTQNRETGRERLPGIADIGEWLDEPLKDGSRQRITLISVTGEDMVSFVIRYWSDDTYLRCFSEAGFKDVRIQPLRFAEEEHAEIPQWQRVEEQMSCSLLIASKT